MAKLADGREVVTDRFVDGLKYNVYDCPEGHPILSADIDSGVTPFLMHCPDHHKGQTHMNKLAQSRCYRFELTPDLLPLRFVWRNPTEAECAAASPGMNEHYTQGGLHCETIE